MLNQSAEDFNNGLAECVMDSPTSYHAAHNAGALLAEAGFTQLSESADFESAPGGYFVIRDGAIIAWHIPENADPAAGFQIVGAHTDSPSFKLKPNPSTAAYGWAQAGVEIYGGPLLNSWLDRELRFAGRVHTVDGAAHLVCTAPIARIPQLAIHLDREIGTNGLKLDRQKHTNPIWALTYPDGQDLVQSDLLQIIAEAVEDAEINHEDITGYDILMADSQPPAHFGAHGEFFAAGRLDNLSSTYTGLAALLNYAANPRKDGQIPVLASFDHEEIGSATRTGAAGPMLEEILNRILLSLDAEGQTRYQALAASWHLSADAGHVVHPNYAERHDPANHPRLNSGPLIKINANQRYATDGAGVALVKSLAAQAGVPVQEFVSNNSMPCGSTIGPITATRLGIRTVDLGIGLLSMHSAREMCGTQDPLYLAQLLNAFFGSADH
ncbi:M18 family aminopeptidase [Micrococcoides hystricis]|uniref:M18 family aminopeptidase n=1 Tax=Micrococcoides hystricis TaxID=1572761 RepID=A0ABV6PBD9_9MICC